MTILQPQFGQIIYWRVAMLMNDNGHFSNDASGPSTSQCSYEIYFNREHSSTNCAQMCRKASARIQLDTALLCHSYVHLQKLTIWKAMCQKQPKILARSVCSILTTIFENAHKIFSPYREIPAAWSMSPVWVCKLGTWGSLPTLTFCPWSPLLSIVELSWGVVVKLFQETDPQSGYKAVQSLGTFWSPGKIKWKQRPANKNLASMCWVNNK